MNLYLLSAEKTDYDQYDAVLMAAENEDEAKELAKDMFKAEGYKGDDYGDDQGKISVQKIGVAEPEIEKGEVISSFNAG